MSVRAYDTRACALGEGPLWHPERAQLFWFDILGKHLLSRETGTAQTTARAWDFGEHVSAAGWIDANTLLIASETGLDRFDLESGTRERLVPLEADDPRTRSNDGRADPWGGFWIGTMGKAAEPELGAIYRYYRGELRQLFVPVRIPNAICFSPDRRFAYFADTASARIMRQPLEGAHGWPKGAPEVLIDLAAAGLLPDGAVTDAQGCIWNAQWGAARIARYSADGAFLSEIAFPAAQTSCPAFGGPQLTTLFATSAADGDAAPGPQAGMTFAVETGVAGLAEHRVIL